MVRTFMTAANQPCTCVDSIVHSLRSNRHRCTIVKAAITAFDLHACSTLQQAGELTKEHDAASRLKGRWESWRQEPVYQARKAIVHAPFFCRLITIYML